MIKEIFNFKFRLWESPVYVTGNNLIFDFKKNFFFGIFVTLCKYLVFHCSIAPLLIFDKKNYVKIAVQYIQCLDPETFSSINSKLPAIHKL